VKRCWKVFCEDDRFPGLWQRWFKLQCVAVGWVPKPGYTMEGKSRNQGWTRARNALKRIEPGDLVLVQLKNNRVARVGEVVRAEIRDNQWRPTVPPTKDDPVGGKGRLIEVRWNLNVGPDDTDTVVLLPPSSRLPASVVRPTICELDSEIFDFIVKAMRDENNWVGLQRRFISERSLSDYIAAYPDRLEDGLLPYPNAKVREKVFPDGTRSDVLLIDKNETPVVVECKQGEPTLKNVKQLRGYMKNVKIQTKKKPRGILVHGGAASLRNEVRRKVAHHSSLKVIRYDLLVRFAPST
jgi:Endonuclease NucS